MNTRLSVITLLLAAGGLLLSAPATARDNHLGHDRDYRSKYYYQNQGPHHSKRAHRRHDDGKYRGHRKHRALGHRHHRPHSRYRDYRHGHRPKVIVIQRHDYRYDHHHSHHPRGLSTITGGVIGGIVGNSLGKGDPIATGFGIMTGAVIGHRIGH